MVERLRRRGFYKSGDKVDDEIKLARLVDSQKYEVFEKKKNTLFALQLYYPLESSGQEEGTCTLNWIFVLIPRIIIHAAIFKSPAHALLHLLSSNYYYSTHPSTLLCSNIRGHAPKTNTASKKKKMTTRSVIHPRTFPQNPATRNCTYYYHHYIYHPSRDLRASLRADALASSVSPSRLVNSTFCARARARSISQAVAFLSPMREFSAREPATDSTMGGNARLERTNAELANILRAVVGKRV